MGFLWHRGVRPRAGTWLFANYFEADVKFGFGEMAASSYKGQSAVLKRKAVGRPASFSKGAKIAVLHATCFYLRSGQAAFRWEMSEIPRLTNIRTCNGLTSNKDKKKCFGNQLKVF